MWLLIVFDVRRLRLVRELELRASKKPGQFYRRYDLDQKDLLDHHIARLKKAGLHGVARRIKTPPVRPTATVIPFSAAQRQRRRAEIKRQAARAARSDAHVQSVLKRARGDA